MGYNFRFNYLFILIKSLNKHTQFDLGLGCANYGDPHYESVATSRTPSMNKRSI